MIARALPICAAMSVLLTTGGAVRAQVLEVGEGGATRTYEGPARFTADGVERLAPLARPRRQRIASPSSGPFRPLAPAAAISDALVSAVAWQESRFRPGVVSRAGAIGEMQLMPATARALGVNPWNSSDNYRGGALYLSQLMRRYDGDLIKSLAAYNAGPKAVDRYGGVPPFRETRTYVSAVLERLATTSGLPSNPSAKVQGQ